MRVLHYLDSVRLEAGGVVRSVLDLCGVLAARGVAVTLETFDAQDVPAEWLRGESGCPNVRVIERRSGSKHKPVVADYDAVHLHTPWDRTNRAYGAACRAAGVPYVISLHGMLDDWPMAQKPWKKRMYWWLVGRKLLEQAATVHVTAQGEQTQSEKWYPRGSSTVLPLVVDLPDADKLPGPQLARNEFKCLNTAWPTLLFLSRVHYKKGIERLIEAVDRLRQQQINVQTVLAGPGDEAYIGQLQRQVRERQLQDRVHFVGMVSGNRKWSLYQACDLFVLPTQQENFGLVLPEALACGTPVVTTTGVDIWPELQAGGGTIVPPRDAAALAGAIAQLLERPEELPALGARGRDYVAEWLNSDRVAADFEALYAQVVSG